VVDEDAVQLADMTNRVIRRRLGENSTFEQRQDAAAALSADSLWRREDQDLREAITDADEVVIEGRRYRQLEQKSSATYHGRWEATRSKSRCTARSAYATVRHASRSRYASGSLST
jgi:hypothetical protein